MLLITQTRSQPERLADSLRGARGVRAQSRQRPDPCGPREPHRVVRACSVHLYTRHVCAYCGLYVHRYIEGPYWLAQILGEAYQMEEDLVISGQEVPKGYWLVDAQWYNLVQARVDCFDLPCI